MARLESYKDPGYLALADAVTKKLDLPEGVLSSIITKGERSDASAVSKDGARTVAQIIPSTRKAMMERHGIDAYLSPENAVEVAGLILKENLEKAQGDVREAVTRYIAGTEGKRGPVTRAYVNRVLGAPETPEASPAASRTPVAPARVVDAYNNGEMTAEQAASFKKALSANQISLPQGVTLNDKVAVKANPGATVIPKRVIDSYNNRSDMTDSQRELLDRDIAAGTLKLPEGATLSRPKPLSFLENQAMGMRNIGTGVAAVGDLAAGALNGAINIPFVLAGKEAPLSTTPFRDVANNVADAAGAPVPVTDAEKLVQGVSEGAVGGMLTAGMGAAGSALPGATGAVARTLAAAPGVDVISGASGGGSSAAAANAGASPLVQLAAGLAGGGVTAVGASRVAARLGPKVAKVIETTPREVLFDEAGDLSDEGLEVAARAGVSKDDLKAAYDQAAEPVQERTVVLRDGTEYPVEVLDPTPVADADGVPHVKVRDESGAEGLVPADEIKTVPVEEATPGPTTDQAASPTAPKAAGEPTPQALPATGAARVDQAASEGVDLSRAQATQDFAAQEAEQGLKAAPTAEGEQARQFYAKQQEQISGAVDRFKSSFGDTSLTAEARGAQVKDAIRELRDSGKAGVTALYRNAEKIAQDAGADAVTLETQPLLGRLREIFIDEAVEDGVRKSLRQQAAKYGLIGENPRTVEGETTVALKDQNGEPAGSVKFTGPQEPLTIANAEKFRQRLNALYRQDTTGAAQSLKGLLDDAVENAVEKAAQRGGGVGQAYKEARSAYREQAQTFKAKDIVQRIADWKKGTQTEALAPERVIAEIFGSGPEAISNLKRVKAVLLNKPTETSKAAWQAIQAQGVAKVFDGALSPSGEVSGVRLRTAIKKFGEPKLRVLLPESDFNQLMKLRRVIGDATIPLAGTTNPSGSGYRVINFLTQQAGRLAPLANLTGVGQVANIVAPLVKQAKAAAASRETLEGVTSFSAKAAEQADERAAKSAGKIAERVRVARDYIDLAKSDRLIAPLLSSTAASAERPN